MQKITDTLKENWIILALMLAGLCVRMFSGISDYILQTDEMAHIAISKGQDLKELLERVQGQNHPPLGFIIRHYWLMLGDGLIWNRLLSLVFGMALIPLSFLVGREAFNRNAGIICAFLTTFLTFPVVHSLVVRNYSMFHVLVFINIYAYLRYSRTDKTSLLILYSITAPLMCFAHFTGLVICAATSLHRAVMLVSSDKKTLLKNIILWILACLPIVAAFLILRHFYFGTETASYNELVKSGYWGHDRYSLGRFMMALLYMLDNIASLGLFFLYLSIIGLALMLRKNRDILLLIVLCPALYILLIVTEQMPTFAARHFSGLYLFLMLGVAKAVEYIISGIKTHKYKHLWVVAIIALLTAVQSIRGIAHTERAEFMVTRDNFNNGLKYLRDNMEEGDIGIAHYETIMHLKFFEDQGKEFLAHTDFGEYRLNGNKLYYASGYPIKWMYKHFYELFTLLDNIQKRRNTEFLKAGTIWYIAAGNYEVEHVDNYLYLCSFVRERMKYNYGDVHFKIFAFSRDDFMDIFITNREKLEACKDEFKTRLAEFHKG